MKLLKILLLILLPTIAFGQVKFNLSENVSGAYNTIKAGDQYVFTVNSTNHADFGKKWYADLNPYYNIGYIADKVSANELLSKHDIGTKWKSLSVFAVGQYNSSFIRGIDHDNWMGLGIGKRLISTKQLSASLSYAYLYQFRKYTGHELETIARNSIRAKVNLDLKQVDLALEYYYQPAFNNPSDLNVFGTMTLAIFADRPINLILQNTYNYISTDKVKVIQSTTIGLKIKIQKQYK